MLYQGWKKKYLDKGYDGLKTSYRKIDPEKRALEEDNERLKKIIAKQALELEVKSELLKKNSYPVQEKIALVKKYNIEATVEEVCK